MLELLHKVDQLSEQGNEMHFNSKMPEAETSDASFHVQRDQSPASQAFGLQLAPPSQRGLIPEHALPSQSPTNAIFSTRLAPASSVQFLIHMKHLMDNCGMLFAAPQCILAIVPKEILLLPFPLVSLIQEIIFPISTRLIQVDTQQPVNVLMNLLINFLLNKNRQMSLLREIKLINLHYHRCLTHPGMLHIVIMPLLLTMQEILLNNSLCWKLHQLPSAMLYHKMLFLQKCHLLCGPVFHLSCIHLVLSHFRLHTVCLNPIFYHITVQAQL